VLALADPLMQRGMVVVVAHLDAVLKEDRPAVEIVGDEVDGAASDFDAVLEGLGYGVHSTAEGGQERWMRIEDAAAVRRDDFRDQDFVEACKDDEANILGPQGLQECGLALSAFGEGGAINQADRHTGRVCASDGRRADPVAPDQDNSRRKRRIGAGIQ
jgi:hypothetical protein